MVTLLDGGHRVARREHFFEALVPADADVAAVQTAALADPKVIAALAGATPRKVIVVPGRMVNVVV